MTEQNCLKQALVSATNFVSIIILLLFNSDLQRYLQISGKATLIQFTQKHHEAN